MDNVDKVEITVKAGDGGDGVVNFRREKYVPLGGPDGGDGGKGGDVYIKADRSMTDLSLFRRKRQLKAESGKNGAGQKKFGKKGNDLEIIVPLGTVVYKVGNGEDVFLDDLSQQGRKTLVAKGGRGGLGNVHFASSTNQAPREATKGGKGEEIHLILDLKLIADVGIIGYPNVGKSTLLSAVSAAKPKAADYPFTTLEPILGEVQVGEKSFVLAEIPGLVEGAHLGKGLGHDFLRHAERTGVLLHLLDGNSPNVIEDMNKLNKELALYKPELGKKPQVVAVNKVDLSEVQTRLAEIKESFKPLGVRVHFISGITKQGVPELMSEIADILDKVRVNKIEDAEPPPVVFRPKPKNKRE